MVVNIFSQQQICIQQYKNCWMQCVVNVVSATQNVIIGKEAIISSLNLLYVM
jgi:hypothetical protein